MGTLVLGLAACNDTADVKPGTEEPNESSEESESNVSELTIQEVFEKAQEASETLNSMHASMDIDQNIKAPSEEVDMNSKITMEMDMIQEPFSMYQNMNMDMGEEGSATVEMYMTEEGFFMKRPESDAWLKLPSEMYEQLAESMTAGADPTLDMESFEQFVDDFTFEQNDKEYILNLKASGEKFNTLIQEELESAGIFEDMTEEETAVLETMEIHQLDYEIFIDKETFHTTAFNMVMDMEMGEETERIRIAQNIKADISKINEIEEIKVPQEVLDNAVEQ